MKRGDPEGDEKAGGRKAEGAREEGRKARWRGRRSPWGEMGVVGCTQGEEGREARTESPRDSAGTLGGRGRWGGDDDSEADTGPATGNRLDDTDKWLGASGRLLSDPGGAPGDRGGKNSDGVRGRPRCSPARRGRRLLALGAHRGAPAAPPPAAPALPRGRL